MLSTSQTAVVGQGSCSGCCGCLPTQSLHDGCCALILLPLPVPVAIRPTAHDQAGDLDVVEGILYVMTFGFILEELTKFWKVGRYYFGFWNAFNGILYALLTTSFVIRMLALTHSDDQHNSRRSELNKLGYHFFAFSAPMFWMRLLLYFDGFRFFGAMLVVLKVMMRESLIFFALLLVVCIGFLQAV